MRFEDLPENWTTLPLDDAPLAAGVIDLVMGHHDRARNSLLLLPCDEYDVGLPAPVVIADTDWLMPAGERRDVMSFLAQLPGAGFVVAMSAKHRLQHPVVKGWLRTIEDQLDSTGQALLAFGVATNDSELVEIVGGRAARNGSMGAVAG